MKGPLTYESIVTMELVYARAPEVASWEAWGELKY